MIKIKKIFFVIFVLGFSLSPRALSAQVRASSPADYLSTGQSIYVPVYSHIYHGDKERPFDLTATLSIRNTDTKRGIFLVSVEYFNSEGDLLRNYIEKSTLLKRLVSVRYVIKSSDKSGGSGAKFIVRWESKERVNPPIVEAIMISTKSQQGISFISRGQVIIE